MTNALEVRNLAKTYGSGEHAVPAVGNLTFDVVAGEFVCVVGPSGCGKTTLLKCLSGLIESTRGEAVLNGKRIVGPPDGLAIVFQEYGRSLLPWMTVRGNVMFPLASRRHLSKSGRQRLADDALAAVGLSEFARKHPWQLSGGMQQRVAIARALAYQPQLLLMDEPFASVDAQTRADLEDLVLEVHAEFGITIVFVTHDIDEAVYLADRVVVLSHRPTTVKEIVDIDLSRPRDQIATKSDPEFVDLRARVFQLVREEQPAKVVDGAPA